MRIGHSEAQRTFLDIGEALGFEARKSFSSEHPTDGVWLFGPRQGILAGLPAVAVEVIVSESAKTIDGSIHRLEAISPTVGVILVQEDEITRRLLRSGFTEEQIAATLTRDCSRIDGHIRCSKQRLQRWSYAQLQWLRRLTLRSQLHTQTTTREFELPAFI